MTSRSRRRQAIILIHGIGEQRPMETALNFARSLAQDDEIRVKPTAIGINGETQRISIKEAADRPRTDIYEYYWAHKFRTNSLGTINRWMFAVFFQCLFSRATPGFLRKRLEFVLATAACCALPIAYCAVTYHVQQRYGLTAAILFFGFSFVLYKAFLSDVLYGYVADAAKYLSNHPDNISAREEVRNDGLKLLEQVIATGDYERVIIAGHSLGSVIGYDVLLLAWARFIERIAAHAGSNRAFLVNAFNELGKDIDDGSRSAEQFQKKQRLLRTVLAESGVDWIVSDLVTLGSPLSFANFLVAKNQDDYLRRTERFHLLLKCPPHGTVEDTTFARNGKTADGQVRYCYYPTYNSLFLCTSWTNIYFATDPVGGRLRPLFGHGVFDIALPKGVYGLSHVRYFSDDAAVKALKRALKLEVGRARDSDEDYAWLHDRKTARPAGAGNPGPPAAQPSNDRNRA